LSIAGILGSSRDPRAEANQAFAAVSPLEQFFQSPQERPPGGVRGGVPATLTPEQESVFPREEEVAAAQARMGGIESALPGAGGAILGGIRQGGRFVGGLGARVGQQLGKLPGGEALGEFSDELLEVIERQRAAERVAKAPLPARAITGLAQFGTEIAAIPGASKLLALRAPRAATAAGRIAKTSLGEGAKFSALESGLSLLEGESPEEAASRGRVGFVAGITIGGVLKGAGEVLTRKAPERAAQAILERNRAIARQNLAETAELGEKVRPKIQRLREAEGPVEVKPPEKPLSLLGEAPQHIDPATGGIRGHGRPQPPGTRPSLADEPKQHFDELGQIRGRGRDQPPSLAALLRSEQGGIRARPDPLETRVGPTPTLTAYPEPNQRWGT
ncbi:hypothetical protein LCGC14_1655880, partial [marine sediment metagenome]